MLGVTPDMRTFLETCNNDKNIKQFSVYIYNEERVEKTNTMAKLLQQDITIPLEQSSFPQPTIKHFFGSYKGAGKEDRAIENRAGKRGSY